jgi:hypothetical protein
MPCLDVNITTYLAHIYTLLIESQDIHTLAQYHQRLVDIACFLQSLAAV